MGKSAHVVSTNFQFGLTRMAETLAEIKDFPFQQKSFRSMEEALLWLSGEMPHE